MKKHTSSNPTFFFLVHYQVFTGLSALVGRGGGSTQKSLKKSHSCCPRLSNSNPHCETTQILHCCVHWGKNPSQHTHTHTHTHTHSHIWYTPISTTSTGEKTLLGHTHTFTLMFHTNQHYFHWGKKPTWTYTHIHTYGTHKKTYVDIHIFTLMLHTNQHSLHRGKNLRGHACIHTYSTHTSICEPSETPTENSSEKTQRRRRRTMVDLKALAE